MKKTLTNNLGLKILALIIAMILWMAVVNISDPVTTTKIYDVPVKFRNEEVMTEAGFVYTVKDGTDFVKVTVTAPRSVLSTLDKNDFNIVADLSERRSDNTVPLSWSVNKSKIEDVTLGHDDVILEVEELVTRQIAVELATEGVPMNGYAVGEVTAEPNLITVSGPASVMSEVERVKATLDIDECFETVQANCRVDLLDKNGESVSRDRISFSDEDIMVTANFLPTKTIDLKFETSGVAAPGYGAIEIKADPEVITICGQSADIANVSVINIPAEELDITNLDKDLTKTINVEQYLQDNLKVLSSDGGNVKVTVSIKKVSEKTVNIPVSDITVKNLKSGLSYAFVDENGNQVDKVAIKVLGLEEELGKLSATDVKVVIDAEGLSTGKQHVEAQITTPSGTLTEETWLSLQLKRG